jgi:hypothetical protein
LKPLGRYNKILTAFVLALYVFIATPVSLWHHHKAQSPVASSVEKIIKATTTNSSDADCPICQHHYSTFSNGAVTYSQSPFIEIRSFNTYYSSQHLPSPAFSKANKGPPFLT